MRTGYLGSNIPAPPQGSLASLTPRPAGIPSLGVPCLWGMLFPEAEAIFGTHSPCGCGGAREGSCSRLEFLGTAPCREASSVSWGMNAARASAGLLGVLCLPGSRDSGPGSGVWLRFLASGLDLSPLLVPPFSPDGLLSNVRPELPCLPTRPLPSGFKIQSFTGLYQMVLSLTKWGRNVDFWPLVG